MTLIVRLPQGFLPDNFEDLIRGTLAKHYPDVPDPVFKNDKDGNRVAIISGLTLNQEQALEEHLAPVTTGSSSEMSRLRDELKDTLPINEIEENRAKA
ncbi:hypothetical protein [Massilia sp. LjRoot122]|uniref:hypothetical protein n=1 Tax=Massilia sp. LjRoot122 TaxID=3342257 RepID=UPI003ED1022B